MIKNIFIEAQFCDMYAEESVEVPTGETKKTFFGEKKITRTEKQEVYKGKSICKIDGKKLSEDLEATLSKLEKEGYEILSITPVLSGNFDYAYEPLNINSSARILKETEKISGSGGYGFGYGYSYTQGLIVIAKK